MLPLTRGSLNLSKASQFGSALRALALRIYPLCCRRSLPRQPFTAAERRLRQGAPPFVELSESSQEIPYTNPKQSLN